MPTVVRSGNLRVMVFGPPREHPPPHVHVYKGHECAVVIWLGDDESPPSIREVYDMPPHDVARAFRLIEEHRPRLLEAWNRIHG